MSGLSLPPWWLNRVDHVAGFVQHRVRRGQVRTLCTTRGGRPVFGAFYGQPEPQLRGPANFNSALGGRRPDAYYRRGRGVRQRPVLMVLAGVHGGEVEGMTAALSLMSILETGQDLRGNPQAELGERLDRLRLIVLPQCNPDGRARCPYDGWAGVSIEEMHRWSQGTRASGEPYGWPGCKQVHPMRGDVGTLGAYFDDAGVNLMHDQWHKPMCATTIAMLELVAEEGPDLLLDLHGHEGPPAVLETNYVPLSVKAQANDFARLFHSRCDARGFAHDPPPAVEPDGRSGDVAPAFNLTSMLYHTGAAMAAVYESPQGLAGEPATFDYSQILDAHHLLFEAAADWLCAAAGE
jgi:hypothetical protein